MPCAEHRAPSPVQCQRKVKAAPALKARCLRPRTEEVARKSDTLFKKFCKNRQVGNKRWLAGVLPCSLHPSPTLAYERKMPCVYLKSVGGEVGGGEDAQESKPGIQEHIRAAMRGGVTRKPAGHTGTRRHQRSTVALSSLRLRLLIHRPCPLVPRPSPAPRSLSASL